MCQLVASSCALGMGLLRVGHPLASKADAICLRQAVSSLPPPPCFPHSKHLKNLFPIAYYGLRTSGGKLGRWKYLEVRWGEVGR